MLGQSREHQLRLRQALTVAYSRQVASAFVPSFIRVVREHIAGWSPDSVQAVLPEVERMAFAQYCQVMCGRSLQEHFDDCLMVTRYNLKVGGRFWPFATDDAPGYQSARTRVLSLMEGLVRAQRAVGADIDSAPTIIDTLRRVRDASGEPLSQDEVVCYSMYGFAGSYSYLGRLVGFMLSEILRDPDLLDQLRAEVDQAFAEGIQDATDVRQLRLLQAVYRETLRYHSISQELLFSADQNFVKEADEVCKDDLTALSPAPMNFSPDVFKEPEKFDPNRFLEPRNEHKQGNAFHPFGIGNRACSAMGLVELMAVTMVATMLHHLRFSQAPSSYQPKLSVKPLPAPVEGLKILSEGAREASQASIRGLSLVEEQVLADFPGLDEPEVRSALAAAESREFEPGMEIIREGDAADAFYVLLRGSVEVTRSIRGTRRTLAHLEEGDYFGEIGLLQDIPRTATVTAGEAGAETLVLSREAFIRVVSASDFVCEELARVVRKRIASRCLLEAWPHLTPDSIGRVMSDFTTQEHAPHDVIIKQGEESEYFFILTQGEVVVSRETRNNVDEEVARLSPGEYFGEMGLLYGGPRRATVSVSGSGPASVLVTDKAGFQKLLGEAGGMRAELARAMLARVRKLALHRS